MATWQFDIPDTIAPRVIQALCVNFGYQALIDGNPNPETKVQFAKRKVREWLKDQVVISEMEKAVTDKTLEVNGQIEAARRAAEQSARTEIVIT